VISNSIPHALVPIAIAALLVTPALYGQDDGAAGNSAPLSEPAQGFHLYNVSVYSGYATNAYSVPSLYLINALSAPTTLGPDEMYGGQITVGWQRNRLRTELSVVYSGGYSGMVQHSNLDGVNQSLTVNIRRRVTPRWTATVFGWAGQQTMMQYLFEPASFAAAAQSSVRVQDFGLASSASQLGPWGIGSMQGGTSVLESPAQSLLLGERFVTYSADAELTYAFSPRAEFHLSSFSAAGQDRVGGTGTAAGTVVNSASAGSVLPFSIGGNAGAGFSYMLTPHTTVGGDASEYLIWNRYEHARGTKGNVSVAHQMTMHSFLRAYGGGSVINMTESAVSQPLMHLLIGGGSLGWQTPSQILAAAYDRSSNDSFGSVVGRVNSETASWSWHRPDSIWSASVGLAEQQMSDPGFAGITGWRGVAQFSFRLQNRETLEFEYAHLRASGVYGGVFNRFQVDSIRVSLAWVPARFSH
jgi:hypothetical protein